ncbi:hypothetical protein F4810DRAFT_707342 [Camillea tinctor]|nr:hypothetical protein F4810DRAFT_707342 [Camillea tinctor]
MCCGSTDNYDDGNHQNSQYHHIQGREVTEKRARQIPQNQGWPQPREQDTGVGYNRQGPMCYPDRPQINRRDKGSHFTRPAQPQSNGQDQRYPPNQAYSNRQEARPHRIQRRPDQSSNNTSNRESEYIDPKTFYDFFGLPGTSPYEGSWRYDKTPNVPSADASSSLPPQQHPGLPKPSYQPQRPLPKQLQPMAKRTGGTIRVTTKDLVRKASYSSNVDEHFVPKNYQVSPESETFSPVLETASPVSKTSSSRFPPTEPRIPDQYRTLGTVHGQNGARF